MYLLHETSLRHAINIINMEMISSITPPHPAEFIHFNDEPTNQNVGEIIFHDKFIQIGGFKGRGVILIFEWIGNDPMVIPEILMNNLEPNTLYDITTNGYWHSRIGSTTEPLLFLRNAIIRGDSLNNIAITGDCDLQPYADYRSSYKMLKNIEQFQCITCPAAHPQYQLLKIRRDGLLKKMINYFEKDEIVRDNYIFPLINHVVR